MCRNHLLVALLITASSIWAQAPVLSVTKATNKEVDLSWTGTSTSYSVQRRVLGGSFSTIATASTSTYADTTVDPYTDYQYQVLLGATPSNSVSVGPPPAGFNNVAPAPSIAGTPITTYGLDGSLVFDNNGDPAFAFLFGDPNQDNDYTDTSLLFRSWNRAAFTWNPVVTIGTVGDVSSNSRKSVSLAYDSSTGIYAVASEFATAAQSGVRIYTSSDTGRTWTLKQTYASASETHYGPSLALSNGNIYIAFIVDTVGIQYYSGTLSAAGSSWVLKTPTPPANTDIAIFGTNPSLALDSNGTPAVAYWVPDTRDDESYNGILLYWRPIGNATPVKVADTQNNQSNLNVTLKFYKTNPRILFDAQRNDAEFGVTAHFIRSDDGGTTWQPVVVIPPDIGTSTGSPFDLALDSQGHGAVAFDRNGGTGSDVCGEPKVSRSNDLVNWTTCAVADVSITAKFDAIPNTLQIAFGGNDKLFLLWQDTDNTDSGVGMLLYREPPAGVSAAPVIQPNPLGQPQVSDGAGFRPNIVSGSWVTIFGANFADAPAIWSNLDFSNGLPTLLGGIQVKFNGQLAATYYAQSDQINVQAPSALNGSVSVQVFKNGVGSNIVTANAASHAPGIFTYTLDSGKTFYAAAVYADSIIVGDPAAGGGNAVRKAKANDVVQLYSTGLGQSTGGILVNPTSFQDAVTVNLVLGPNTFQGQQPVTFLVAPGEYQTNFTVPPGLAPGNYTITLTTSGAPSQPGVLFPVGN